MFCLDLETLGVESTSVCLSIGAVYFDPESNEELSYNKLMDESLFIKFDAQEQVKVYNRTRMASTLEWWKKQGRLAQELNLLPGKNDVTLIEGLTCFNTWFNSKPGARNDMIWVRGHLDQPVFESLYRSAGIECIVPYSAYRDVRTAIECFYPKSKNGYVDVDTDKVKDYDPYKVIKHHPSADCAMDICQLLAGVV